MKRKQAKSGSEQRSPSPQGMALYQHCHAVMVKARELRAIDDFARRLAQAYHDCMVRLRRDSRKDPPDHPVHPGCNAT